MPQLSDLRPGGTIYSVATSGRGTLTCFVMHSQRAGKLYGVTARHVIPQGTYCAIGDPAQPRQIVVGGPAEHAPKVDFLYFEIDEEYVPQLTKANFFPIGFKYELTQVWDPTEMRQKVASAKSADEENELKRTTKFVLHLGSTQAVLTRAEMDKYSNTSGTQISRTTIASGDSGGAVFDYKAMKYVGLISFGNEKKVSQSGGVIFLHDALRDTGLTLATWAARAHWCVVG